MKGGRSSPCDARRPKTRASMSDDLPAPVGPVMAKRSRPERSRASFSRKEVKPSTSSLSGLMSGHRDAGTLH